jgi:hypothetical protein
MRSLVGILCCMSVAGGAWAVQGNLHDLEYVTASAEELHPSGIPRETAQAASGNAAVQDSPEGYRIQAVVFEGGKSFSQEQFGRLLLAGDEARAGEANASRLGAALR